MSKIRLPLSCAAVGNWKNHYIELVQGSPEYFLEEDRGAFSTEAEQSFLARKRSADSVLLEIGSGSGMHLLHLAEENPNALCIGVELRYKRAYRTIEKGLERELKNIFMIRGDIRSAMHLFSPEELSAIFIHFPDPWEKKRWRKHRLLQEPFLGELLKCLQPGATLSFRSDHAEYFQEASRLLEQRSDLSPSWITENLYHSPHKPERPLSEFESLFVSKGVKIGACVMTRV